VQYTITTSAVHYKKELTMRKRKHVNYTIAPETDEFINSLVDSGNGRNKGVVIDLLVDVIRGNVTTDMIEYHYYNVFEKLDGRRKDYE